MATSRSKDRCNKELGNDFEAEFADLLNNKGYWVHLIAPNKSGAQPFDVIASKDNMPWAFDCKTTVTPIFPISRLEDNQTLAFDRFIDRGNDNAFVAVKYNNEVFLIYYPELKKERKVDLRECRSIK